MTCDYLLGMWQTGLMLPQWAHANFGTAERTFLPFALANCAMLMARYSCTAVSLSVVSVWQAVCQQVDESLWQ